MAHGGQDVVWDWGGENPDAIKWAAFYSDCEHEVMEVKSGHVRFPGVIPRERQFPREILHVSFLVIAVTKRQWNKWICKHMIGPS